MEISACKYGKGKRERDRDRGYNLKIQRVTSSEVMIMMIRNVKCKK